MLRLYGMVIRLFLFLLGARRRRLDEGEVSLVYYTLGPGSGEPWILLHGLGAVAATWAPVMRALRGECRLLVPELSVLGGTRGPRAGLGVRLGALTMARLIERELEGRPATVAGISLGGWTAVRLALLRPELVARLVLIDAGGYRNQDWERIRGLVTVRDLAGVDRLYKALFVRTPLLMKLSRKGFLRTYTSPSVTETLADLRPGDAFGGEDLGRLSMPTAVIWGERDGLFTVEVGRAMAAAIPGAHLEVIPGCGHAIHFECPARMNAALERFRRAT